MEKLTTNYKAMTITNDAIFAARVPSEFESFLCLWDIQLIWPPIVHSNYYMSKHSVFIGAL